MDEVWKVWVSVKGGFLSDDVLMTREEARALAQQLNGLVMEGKIRDFKIDAHRIQPVGYEWFLKALANKV